MSQHFSWLFLLGNIMAATLEIPLQIPKAVRVNGIHFDRTTNSILLNVDHPMLDDPKYNSIMLTLEALRELIVPIKIEANNG